MKAGSRKGGRVLGLAIGPRSVLVAELAAGNAAQRTVMRLAEFVYPEGLAIEKPEVLGTALGAFLRRERITTRDSVLGLPAKWLVTRRKDVPPATAQVAADMLRLQAETEFSTEDLVVDFAGEPNPSAPTSVLLVATARPYLEQATALARAAGLRALAVTATGTAVGRMTSRSGARGTGEGLVVSVSPEGGGAELVVQHKGSPTQLRHLPVAGSQDIALLAGELRRAAAALPRNGTPHGVTVWDGSGASAGGQLAERLAMPVHVPALREVVSGDKVAAADAARYAPAVAVALAADETPVDFLHSRLAPPPAKANRRPVLWAVIAGVLIIAVATWAYVDLAMKRAEVARIQGQLRSMADDVQAAEAGGARLTHARSWMDGQPHFVRCFRAVTRLFPDEGGLWATSFAMQANMNVQLSGKAGSEEQVLALRDRIKDSPEFTDTKLLDMRDAGRNGREVAFSLSFTYREPKPATDASNTTAPQSGTSRPASR